MRKRKTGDGDPRRRPRFSSAPWRVVVVAAVLVSLLFYLGGGWYFSSVLDTLALSSAAKRAAKPSYPLRVEALSPTAITLGSRSGALGDAALPGVWGVQWPGGAGIVTTRRAVTTGRVTRAFHVVVGTRPVLGQHVGLDSFVYPQNPSVGLGLPYRNVVYHGPLGKYPAWLVAGTSNTWAITVHGNSLSRLDCMKIVPVLHRMGLPVLMITYRNDPGAPRSPHATMRYGQTEWKDLQAAARYALGHGARRLVLVGYSMGGGIVLSFLIHSPLARNVQAVVLDAPVTDFSATVNYGAAQQRLPIIGLPLPQSLTDVAKWIASYRYQVNWSASSCGALEQCSHRLVIALRVNIPRFNMTCALGRDVLDKVRASARKRAGSGRRHRMVS